MKTRNVFYLIAVGIVLLFLNPLTIHGENWNPRTDTRPPDPEQSVRDLPGQVRSQQAQIREAVRRAEEQRRAEEARRAEEQRRAEEARRAEEQRRAEEARRAEEQRRRAEEARRLEEARRNATNAAQNRQNAEQGR